MIQEEYCPTTPGALSTRGWVLVIVREQRLRQLLLTILSRAGYTLLGFPTLAQAEPILRLYSAPKVLLFDGAEAGEERLREQVHQIGSVLPPGIPCRMIAFSLAHPQPRLQYLPGVDALIARPFNLTQVLEKVQVYMAAS